MRKEITITKVSGGYHVHVNDVPLVRSNNGIGLDRAKAGLKTNKKYKAPSSTVPALLTAGEAASMAHQVGRYIFGLGDMAFGYTKLVGVPRNEHDKWWEKAHGE